MKLYKYLTFEKFASHFYDTYLRDRIYLSRFTAMNDPMEGWFHYYLNMDENKADKTMNKKHLLGLCSFSCKNDNHFLWLYYAGGFSGLCLEYTVDQAPDSLMIKKIKYRRSIDFLRRDLSSKKNAENFLTSKLSTWKHESEVRVLCEHRIDTVIDFPFLSGIILGQAMKPEDKSRFLAEMFPRMKDQIMGSPRERDLKIYDAIIEKGVVRINENREQ